MAWLDIERKAEAIMQAAERNIIAFEISQADREPTWDGFCGLVRVCDDAELKERGVIRAVVKPAPPHQGLQQQSASSGLGSAGRSVNTSSRLPDTSSDAKTPNQVTSSPPLPVSHTSMQLHRAVQPQQPSSVVIEGPPPVPSSITASCGPAAQVDDEQQQQQQQQQQHHTPAQQQQQQPASNLSDEPVSIASCLQTLAGSSAVDPLDDLSATGSSPHRGAPSWVMSYLLGHDGSDSDESDGNDTNDRSGRTGNGRGSTGGTGAADPSRNRSAAADSAAMQLTRETLHAVSADSAVTNNSATAANAASISAGPVTAAAAPSDAKAADHPAAAESATLHLQGVVESDPDLDADRVEQLLQEALAAAENEYQQEQQQQQHDKTATAGAGVAALEALGGPPTAAALAAAAAKVLGPGEAAAAAAATTQDHLQELNVAAGAVEHVMSLRSDSRSDVLGQTSPPAAAADELQDAANETAELLDAAADAVELQLKHAAGAAPPVTAALLSTDGQLVSCAGPDRSTLAAGVTGDTGSTVGGTTGSTAGNRAGCTTGTTAGLTAGSTNDVAELLEAAADAAALETTHAAPETALPAAAAVVVPTGNAVGVGESLHEAESAASAAGSNANTPSAGQELRLPCDGVSSNAFDAEVEELLSASADAVTLQNKHATSGSAAAAAVELDTLDSNDSEDEADRFTKAATDASELESKHAAAAAAAAAGGSNSEKKLQVTTRAGSVKSEPEGGGVSSTSGTDSDNDSESFNSSYNSGDEEELLDLLEELPEVPSHVAVVTSRAARQKRGSSNKCSKYGGSNVGTSSGKHSSSCKAK